MKEEEDKLFEKWGNGIRGFVRDGIVDFDGYENANIKIVFVLKEPNDYNDKIVSFKEFLNQGAIKNGYTWNNVVRWSASILDNQVNWDVLDLLNQEDRAFYLKKISIMNLKKISGSGTAIDSEILDSCKIHKEKLIEQINIYNPNIIVCGGTGNFYSEILFDGKPKWININNGISYLLDGERHVFSYFHPACRKDKKILFYNFKNAVKEKLDI